MPAWLCMDLRPGCPCGQGLRPHAAWWAQCLTSCFPTALGIVCNSPVPLLLLSLFSVPRALTACLPSLTGVASRQERAPSFGSSSLGTPRYRAHPSRLGKQVSLTRLPYTPTPTPPPSLQPYWLRPRYSCFLPSTLTPDPSQQHSHTLPASPACGYSLIPSATSFEFDDLTPCVTK